MLRIFTARDILPPVSLPCTGPTGKKNLKPWDFPCVWRVWPPSCLRNCIQSLNLKFITKSTLMRIHHYLWLYVKALDLEGVATEGLTAKMKYVSHALEIKQFSIDQYIDIFQFISKGIQDIIRDYHIDAHRPNLPIVIGQIIKENGTGLKRKGTSSVRRTRKFTFSFPKILSGPPSLRPSVFRCSTILSTAS